MCPPRTLPGPRQFQQVHASPRPEPGLLEMELLPLRGTSPNPARRSSQRCLSSCCRNEAIHGLDTTPNLAQIPTPHCVTPPSAGTRRAQPRARRPVAIPSRSHERRTTTRVSPSGPVRKIVACSKLPSNIRLLVASIGAATSWGAYQPAFGVPPSRAEGRGSRRPTVSPSTRSTRLTS
jgi:hypothetical protein